MANYSDLSQGHGFIYKDDPENLHTNKYEQAFHNFPSAGTAEEVSKAVKNLLNKHEKENFTAEVLKQIHGFIDLTSLTSIDTKESIWKLVDRVNDFEGIRPDVPNVATYIKDCTFRSNSLTVCGRIEFVQERTSQKGKPYLRFNISDGTARMSFSYFIKKKTEEKVRALQQGDWIVCTGENEFYNDRLSFTARYINRGNPPPDFVPEKMPTKAAPAHYKVIFPEKLTDYNQMNLFDRSVIPDCLRENTFVVFDLETTGLVNIPTNGRMDAITEIGAVKIIDGEIRERFTTLVNPERPLSEEIVKLTGITDDMVKDAPKISEVIPDFYKFCEGCYLVGHNVQFDYRFIQYYGMQEEYAFEQKTFDTLSIAQTELFLKNYKLDTIADHYGIVFNHHRACDDALTTAKIFIELIKAKKCLPNA